MTRPLWIGAASVLLAGWFVGLVLAVPAGAQAPDPPAACPDVAADYAGTDDVVRELRALRADVRSACLASRDRLDRAHDDAGQAHDDAGQAHDDALDIKAAIDAIEPATFTAPGADDANPAFVRLASGDTEAQAAVTSLHSGLWFLGGLLVVVAIAPFLLRTFRA